MPTLALNIAPSGNDDPIAVAESKTAWVRFPMNPDQSTRTMALKYRAAGLKVLVCCDADTATNFANQRAAAQFYRASVGDVVDALQVPFNEFDAIGSTSSTRPEPIVYEAIQAWTDVWRSVGIPIIGPGMASGQPDRWSARCNLLVDAIGLHLYSPSAIDMAGTVGAFNARWYKSIWITEFPIWSEAHVTEALRLSQGPAYVYNWRSWYVSSGAHWDDGLLSQNGLQTWRYAMFQKYAKESNMADQVLQDRLAAMEKKIGLLEEQQSLTVDLAARILSGTWDEGASSAEALLRSIAPKKYGKFEAVPFP